MLTLTSKNIKEISLQINGNEYFIASLKIGISNEKLLDYGISISEAINRIKNANRDKFLRFTVTSNRNMHFVLIDYIYSNERELRLAEFGDDIMNDESLYNTYEIVIEGFNDEMNVTYKGIEGSNDYDLFYKQMTLDELRSDIDKYVYDEALNKYVKYEGTIDLDKKYFKYGITYNVKNTYSKIIDNVNIMSFQTMLLPFKLGNGTKIYESENYILGLNHLNAPIKVTLWPYSSIDPSTNIYMLSEIDENSDEFISNTDIINIEASYRFINGELCIYSKWVYDNYGYIMTPWEAYKLINNVDLQEYIDHNPDNVLDDEYNIETSIKNIGYRIEMSSDIDFKDIIYKYDISIDPSKNEYNQLIKDFTFPLMDIFNSWDNIATTIVIRTMFIDRHINNVIYSNTLLLDKEHFKYLINDIIHRRINMNNIENYKFIDKINAIVENVVEDENTAISSLSPNSVRILYKPIFYKVAELQSIKLKRGLKQNIGINLSDIMTKVETFKIVIGGTEHIETGRNDLYVIFNIDASILNTSSGTYYIINQDNEFISDGTWNII